MRRIRVLFLAANPSITARSDLETKVDSMLKLLQTSESWWRVEFVTDWAVSIDDLREVLKFHYPHIVHFIGDGINEGIMMVDSRGLFKPIDSQDLSFLFASTLKDRARLVILHACYMPEQIVPRHGGTPLADLVGCVLGINHRIDASSALHFAATFYRYISQGSSTQDAFNQSESTLSFPSREWQPFELLVKKFYIPKNDVLLPLGEAIGDPISPDIRGWQSSIGSEAGRRTTTVPATLPPIKPVALFVAYAHEDQKLLDQFMSRLNLLRNQGFIGECYESNVTHSEGQAQILEHLNTAKVILLLTSVDFMNSGFIESSYMKRALVRYERGEAYVIPILLRSVSWEGTPFSQLPGLPGNNRAITSREDSDAAFFEIAQSIRLVLEEQGRESLSLVDRVEMSTIQSGPVYHLTDVFVPYSIPKVTYVEGEDFGRLKLELTQKGRNVVIEGSGGIGKTTAIQKAIEEIRSTPPISGSTHVEITSLSANNPTDVKQLETLEQRHRGIVVIDDFHRLNMQLSKKIVDYLKLLADTESETKKLVIVGIPQSGQKLVDLSFDAANRVVVFPWGMQKHELVLQVIEKGEKALNIELKRKMELAIMACGSFNVAQSLCFEVCQQEGVTITQPQLRVIDSIDTPPLQRRGILGSATQLAH
jgi:CHAT domain